jgi:mono/diheme cytochrome c family protein
MDHSPRRRPGGSYARALRAAAIGGVALLMAGVTAFGLLGTPGGRAGQGGERRTAPLDPQDARLVAQGREVYARSCAVCHGALLEGHPSWQEGAANGLASPLDASGPSPGKSDAELLTITRDGSASGMPAFGGALSDEEIRAVLSYIKSTWAR